MDTPTPRGTCRRCSGNGYLPAFAHVAGGKCLACQGTGTRTARVVLTATKAEQDAATAAWNAEQTAKAERIAARAARRAARSSA
jgi:DnaJ-class molecular chaperone